jgi:hypothetical protein
VAHSLLVARVLILIQPNTLSRDKTLKAALDVLQTERITVAGSWFVDADVVLGVNQQDAAQAAAALKQAGFMAMVVTPCRWPTT